jgi:hypothetical protein
MKWWAVALACVALSLTSFLTANAASVTHELRFWGDGVNIGTVPFDSSTSINQGTIWWIDGANPSGGAQALKSYNGAVFLTNDKWKFNGQAIPAATINWTNGEMTDLSVPFFFYFWKGSIYLVDSTVSPPAPVRVSKESGLTPDKICSVNTLINWVTPRASAISFVLAGPDGQCDVTPTSSMSAWMVTLNMGSGVKPISTGGKVVGGIMMDGVTYAVEDMSTTPHKIELCKIANNQLANCTEVGAYNDYFQSYVTDTKYSVGNADGALVYYNIASKKSGVLYIPAENQQVAGANLDIDGNVYFEVVGTAGPPYSNYIMKVLAPDSGNVSATSVTTLASVSTVQPLQSLNSSLRQDYVVFEVPQSAIAGATDDGAYGYSVSKTGTSVVSAPLVKDYVAGGAVGSYFFWEDKNGNVNKIGLDGSDKITLAAKAQLSGCALGGTGNWYYEFDSDSTTISADLRLLVNESGVLKSLDYNLATPISLGTLPVNLSNPSMNAAIGSALLGTAERRSTDYSKGRDVFFCDANASSSFRRLTNDNNAKAVVEPHWGNDY